ncbi:hypothetical protein [Thiohalophilus sp.]|uniref:hypothetical protein n=1 Tax=Thiohalophilus sp. TaxID=3028392 RepID=UPI00397640A6
MADVIPFKKPKASEQHRGKTLCKSGFHKWEVVKGNPFDVKQGKMVTRYRCRRCGATRTEAK